MDLERKDNGDSDEGQERRELAEFSYSDPSATDISDSHEEYPLVPVEVLEGIDDAIEGRTMDGDDLDDALLF